MKKRIWTGWILLFILLLTMPMSAGAAVRLKKSSLQMRTGNAYVLRLTGNSSGKKVSWKSNKSSVVSITSSSHNRAVLKAKKAGTAVITAKVGSKKRRCTVTVKKNDDMPSQLTLTVGSKFRFSAGKKAAWTLSKKKGSLKAASGKKKAVFTARKTGRCKLTVKTKKKTYTCSIKIIRKDGATKADLQEEKALRESGDNKQPETEGSGGSEDPGSGDSGDSGSGGTTDPSTIKLTEKQKSVMKYLAYYACCQALQTEDVYSCSVHVMDLTGSDQAYLIYVYQYMSDDSRITAEGEYNIASMSDMNQISVELFGGALDSTAFSSFCSKYVEKTVGNTLYMNGTGDFGALTTAFFDNPDTVTFNEQTVTIEGRVMSYNTNASTYIHTGTYKAVFGCSENGTFRFESVVIT